MLARCVALGRWEEFALVAGTRGHDPYERDRGPIVLQVRALHPPSVGEDARVALSLAADTVRRDPVNEELGIEHEEAAAAALDANTLLGVIDLALRPGDGLRHAFTGFRRFDRAGFLSRLAADPSALDPIATLAGEDSQTFRARFAERFAAELERNNGRFEWPPYRDRGAAEALAAISGVTRQTPP